MVVVYKLWFILWNIAEITGKIWWFAFLSLSNPLPLLPDSLCFLICLVISMVYKIYKSIFRLREGRCKSDALIFSWLKALAVLGLETVALKQYTASDNQALRLDTNVTLLFRQYLGNFRGDIRDVVWCYSHFSSLSSCTSPMTTPSPSEAGFLRLWFIRRNQFMFR